MVTRLDKVVYQASQRLRVSWYGAQKWASGWFSETPMVPPRVRLAMPHRTRILRDFEALLTRDWRNIEEGIYCRPETMVDGPMEALRKARLFFADLPRVEARRRADANDEVFRITPRGRYPRYYLQNFHYQTDGYLSRRSAELYDHQVEVLFGGGADAMRRQALVPLRRLLGDIGVRRARLLDLACGTGRFLREVKRNYPKLAVTGLDLSGFYLDAARAHLARWSGVSLVEAPAESVPLPASGTDIITCIFLFHELPPKLRHQVVAEMARLLRPGGAVILVDSLQRGDAPDYDSLIDYFPRAFHEPYYRGYANEDLTALFAKAGLTLEEAGLAYLAKVMVFRKSGARAHASVGGSQGMRATSMPSSARSRASSSVASPKMPRALASP